MERDPLRFVRRTAAALHAGCVALLLLAAPLVWLAFDLVRVLVDDAIAGGAFAGGAATVPFLRVAIALPERLSEGPIVLFEGVELGRAQLIAAAPATLVAVAALLALIAILIGLIRSMIGSRVVDRLRRTILDGILSARPSARDEARHAAALAGEGLARESGFLSGAVLIPAAAGMILALVLLHALVIDWRLAAAVVAALGLVGVVWPQRATAARRAAGARLGEGAALRRSLTDLARRLPAVRSHGTAALERRRLSEDLGRRHASVASAERQLGIVETLGGLAVMVAPVVILGVGAWFASRRGLTAGEIVASAAATILGMRAVVAFSRWHHALNEAGPLFEEIGRTLGALQSRGRVDGARAVPGSGALVARGIAAYDPASGARITGVDLSVAFPAHVALVGEAGAGARVFAAVIGGRIDPSLGTLAFGGVDLATCDPAERARRIAFAGGETILISGSLRENLAYGYAPSSASELEQRLIEAVTVAGLDRLVHARGLAGTIDPNREARLGTAIIDARRAVRAALAAERLDDCVDPFDPKRFNAHATIAENILFGVPLGDTFREANLPSHPFVRAILEAEDLTKPLSDIGLSIARSMVEIFGDVPDGHPLFERFSFFSASERGYFEDLVERQGERRRGAEAARDRERLIGLALRYDENRHRLGLVDAALQARLLSARASFAQLLPTSLQPAIEFYDPDRVCAAASLQDNLLFGRVAHDRAGAEAGVHRVIRRVLTERGLDQDVFRVGLESRVDARGEDLAASEIAAIDLVRCLIRRPDMLVAEHALDGLTEAMAEGLVQRLRRALVGQGLVLATPYLSGRMDDPPFDLVVRFERGTIVKVEDRRRRQEAA